MCGPLAAAQGVRAGRSATARYAGGRLLSYSVAGALAGATGRALFATTGPVVGALLSASFAAALVLVAVRLWRRSSAGPAPLAIGKRRRPLAARIISGLRPGPFGFGALTVLLPCGALWAGLALAAGTGEAAAGAAAMLGFAGASSLGLLAGGWIGAALGRRRLGARRTLAVLLVAGAAVVALRPFISASATDDVPPCHRLLGASR
jgi:sulfite exporter TauE/SafE